MWIICKVGISHPSSFEINLEAMTQKSEFSPGLQIILYEAVAGPHFFNLVAYLAYSLNDHIYRETHNMQWDLTKYLPNARMS